MATIFKALVIFQEYCLHAVLRLNRKIVLYRYKVLFPTRIRLCDDFLFGKDFSIVLQGSNSSIQFGRNVYMRDHTRISVGENARIIIGNRVFLNHFCSVHAQEQILIGSDTQFGEGVRIYDHNHAYTDSTKHINQQGYTTSPVRIGRNCWIGSNVIILRGVEIGDNCVIGAGCVIHSSIPPNKIVLNHQNLIIKEKP